MKQKILSLLALLIPSLAPAKSVTADASWYGKDYDGRLMANGQPFDHKRPTMATYEFPLGTWVWVKYTSAAGQHRMIRVQVTDRGPSEKWRSRGRKFDLSFAAFKMLESPKKGVIRITVTDEKNRVTLDGLSVTK